MDVGTNNFSTGNGYGSAPMHSSTAAPSGAEGEAVDQVIPKRRVQMPYGDSILVGNPLPRRAPVQSRQQMDPAQLLKNFQIARFLLLGLGALSLLAFFVMALQPLLLPIFTLGACFANGAQEWMEFSGTILHLSLFPGGAGLLLLGAGYYFHRQVTELSEKLSSDKNSAQSPSALMARLPG